MSCLLCTHYSCKNSLWLCDDGVHQHSAVAVIIIIIIIIIAITIIFFFLYFFFLLILFFHPVVSMIEASRRLLLRKTLLLSSYSMYSHADRLSHCEVLFDACAVYGPSLQKPAVNSSITVFDVRWLGGNGGSVAY